MVGVAVTVSVCASVDVPFDWASVADDADPDPDTGNPNALFALSSLKHPTCTPLVLSIGIAKHRFPSTLHPATANDPSVSHVATLPSMHAI